MELLGFVGLFVFFAGVHLTWQSRRAILYWMEFLVRTWRSSLQKEGAKSSSPVRQPETLRLTGGVALMILGQILFVLALVF